MKFNSQTERNRFIESNLPLVTSRVRKRNNGVFDEDLFQEGVKALIISTDRFDEIRGIEFSTYAVKYIDGYILTYKNYDSLIKPLQKKARNNRFEHRDIMSLDIPIGEDGEKEITVGDTICESENFERDIIDTIVVNGFLNSLCSRDRFIIESVMNCISQCKISKMIGISQPQVHRIIKRVGERYRRYQLV